jgi:twinkle protein
MITPLEFAERHFGKFEVKGKEIIPKLCPYCKGGNHGDEGTFALNMDKLTFNCRRGTCGETGTFYKLLKDFGELEEREKKKKFLPPVTKPPRTEIEKYFAGRGINKATLQRWRVRELQGGEIVFPYYDENDILVYQKYRTMDKSRMWQQEGGKAIFWGMNLCVPDNPLVIVEGEPDCLTLSECGIPNTVSVPSGASNLTCVDTCWPWLEKFKEIIIWGDNDDPGREMVQKLVTRLGEYRCKVVQSKYKDANEHLMCEGRESVINAFIAAKYVDIRGLLKLAEVVAFDIERAEKVRSSIEMTNKKIGGYMMGQLSVWTGFSGSGKSTILGQELIKAVDQGYNVCAYSGELPAALFRFWIELQMSGPHNLTAVSDGMMTDQLYRVDRTTAELMRKWYQDKFFLYDNSNSSTASDILRVFEYAARRYGCRVFLIDNIMTTAFEGGERDYYRQQGEFVGRLIDFVHKFNVHVHLVAHPRKTEGLLTKNDVSGTHEIASRADNVFAFYRLTDEDRKDPGFREYDALIDVLKNRFLGEVGYQVPLKFDRFCKRFYRKTDEHNYKYGWEKEIIAPWDREE